MSMARFLVRILLAVALALPAPLMASAYQGGELVAVHHGEMGDGDQTHRMPGAGMPQDSSHQFLCCNGVIGQCALTGLIGLPAIGDHALTLHAAGPWTDTGDLRAGRTSAADPPPPRT